MRRVTLRWRTPLGRFVGDFGVQRLTRELNAVGAPVTEKAVYHWLSGAHVPRIEHAAAIVRISSGRLTIEKVYRQRVAICAGKGPRR